MQQNQCLARPPRDGASAGRCSVVPLGRGSRRGVAGRRSFLLGRPRLRLDAVNKTIYGSVPMSFKMDCPHCKRTLNVTDKVFGKTVACPGCNQSFTVPASPPRSVVKKAQAVPPPSPRQAYGTPPVPIGVPPMPPLTPRPDDPEASPNPLGFLNAVPSARALTSGPAEEGGAPQGLAMQPASVPQSQSEHITPNAVQVNVGDTRPSNSLGIGSIVLAVVGLLTLCIPFCRAATSSARSCAWNSRACRRAQT